MAYPGETRFVTKFSDRIGVSLASIHPQAPLIVTIEWSSEDDADDEVGGSVDLSLLDARDLAIALYHAVCAAEAEGRA